MTSDPMASRLTVPAGHGKAVRLRLNEGLRIINTHGTQVVDCCAWNANDLDDFMCMETTRVWNQRLNPITGDSFVTNLRNPILTVIADTSPGAPIADARMRMVIRARLPGQSEITLPRR